MTIRVFEELLNELGFYTENFYTLGFKTHRNFEEVKAYRKELLSGMDKIYNSLNEAITYNDIIFDEWDELPEEETNKIWDELINRVNSIFDRYEVIKHTHEEENSLWVR